MATGVVIGLDRLPAVVEPAAYDVVVTTIRVGVLALAATCAAWWVRRGVRAARGSNDARAGSTRT